MKPSAIFAASFDPITYGHLWIIQEASKLFGKVVIAVASNPAKSYMFSAQERYNQVSIVLKDYDLFNCFAVTPDKSYIVDYANRYDIKYMIRGIRNVTDFVYEQEMCYANYQIRQSIKTVFLIPPAGLTNVSSSFVKALIGYGGWEDLLTKYVPCHIKNELLRKYKE